MLFDTIILRFRDLVTEIGGTIAEHQAIIKEQGSVWWAWWRKGNETPPVSELSELRTYSESYLTHVYLLDSGRKLLYKAVCKEIRFHPAEEIPSPKSNQTPKYYRTHHYAAWFCFSRIEECDSNEIHGYSYVQVASQFTDSDSNYEMFSEKRISSMEELIQQNRTLWFIRKYKETDRDKEIVLLNAHIAEPSDFVHYHTELQGNSILWLSDLHFDDPPPFPVSKQKTPEQATLTDHLKHMCYGKFSDISALLISGDITNCGKKEGFNIALDFIEDLNRELKKPLSSETIVFCPGNHDFIRKKAKLAGKAPEYLADHLDSAEAYRDFYHNIHSKYPNRFFACGRKFLTSSGHTVEIAALNSVILQQYRDFEGHGFLSQEQLDFVAQNMGWDDSRRSNSIRIAMMHHHYLPTCMVETIDTQKASSVVYDAERLMRWLIKYRVRVLLHGHKHRTFSAAVEFPTRLSNQFDHFSNDGNTFIIGMGSTGAADYENFYAVLYFDVDTMEIRFYKVLSDSSREDYLDHTIRIPI